VDRRPGRTDHAGRPQLCRPEGRRTAAPAIDRAAAFAAPALLHARVHHPCGSSPHALRAGPPPPSPACDRPRVVRTLRRPYSTRSSAAQCRISRRRAVVRGPSEKKFFAPQSPRAVRHSFASHGDRCASTLSRPPLTRRTAIEERGRNTRCPADELFPRRGEPLQSARAARDRDPRLVGPGSAATPGSSETPSAVCRRSPAANALSRGSL